MSNPSTHSPPLPEPSLRAVPVAGLDAGAGAGADAGADAGNAITAAAGNTDGGLWDRLSNWASRNKAFVYSIAGIAVVVTGAGAIYYLSSSSGEQAPPSSPKKKSKKAKQRERKRADDKKPPSEEKAAKAQVWEELPEVTPESVEALDTETRNSYAIRLKTAGNSAFSTKDYEHAILLYTQSLLCKKDPVYYSNRAACYNSLKDWDKVIEDTTSAINMDDQYVKAINRRANAHENLGQPREALVDYMASCIIDNFSKEQPKNAVERILNKIAEEKGQEIIAKRGKKMPSPTFVTHYLQAFRHKDLPAGLATSVELEEGSGKWHLRKGLVAIEQQTAEDYEEAAKCLDRAIEIGGLGEYEALALNMRSTFEYLRGDREAALKDINRSLEIDPTLTQSYVKRATLHLEAGARDAAWDDFDAAISHNKDDPDIYYHRAQLHFLLGEFPEAAKDHQKSIDLDPDFIYSHIQLGVTQYKSGSIASAMATFRRALKTFENASDVYNYYGELLLDQKKYPEAIEKFDHAVKLDKKHRPRTVNVLPLINKALLYCYWKNGFDEAVELCEEALKIDPECDIAVATIAQLHLQQGKVTEALGWFEKASYLARTQQEVVTTVSYEEVTRAQLEVRKKYPKLVEKMAMTGSGAFGM